LIEQWHNGSFASYVWTFLVQMETLNYCIPNFFKGIYAGDSAFELTCTKNKDSLKIQNIVHVANVIDLYIKGY